MSLGRSTLNLLVIALAVGAGPVAAAVTFTATTRATGSTRMPVRLGNSVVSGSIDGERGRFEFQVGSVAPSAGTVLLTEDGGQETRFYDPVYQRCGRWAPRSPKASPSLASRSFENLQIEKATDEAGGELVGQSTRHLRFVFTYEEIWPGGKAPRRWRVERTDDLWLSAEPHDEALAVWLAPRPAMLDGAELDRRIAEAMKEATGLVLKRSTVETRRLADKEPESVTTTLEVTSLEVNAELPPDSFVEPFLCKIPSPDERR